MSRSRTTHGSAIVLQALLVAGILAQGCGTDPVPTSREVDGGLTDAATLDSGRDASPNRDAAGRDGAAGDSGTADTLTSTDTGVDAPVAVDGGEPGCEEGGPGCICTTEPRSGLATCVHSFGGLYGPNACSGSYQCCAGTWARGTGSCAPCACTEVTGRTGCSAEADLVRTCFNAFDGRSEPLPPAVRARMMDVSYRAGCPVGLDALSYLTFPHWGFDGTIHRGEMVVATSVATDVLSVFEALYSARFPLERVELVDNYGADDDASMAVNNSSAFNCRQVTGGTRFSEHSFGTAIDLNPRQNPYVSGSTVLPPEGRAFLDRADVRQGMFVSGGLVTAAFDRIGWTWGGNFGSLKDYQHFSASGS